MKVIDRIIDFIIILASVIAYLAAGYLVILTAYKYTVDQGSVMMMISALISMFVGIGFTVLFIRLKQIGSGKGGINER